MPATLGYWQFRGIVEPIRFLLYHVGEPFEDKRYITRVNSNKWFVDDKERLGLWFPNLPYYIDGDIKITQSLAILRHLARRHGLNGANETDQVRIENVEQQLLDLRKKFHTVIHDKTSFEASKAAFIESLPNDLNRFSVFLGTRDYLVGDYLTYVDFLAYDLFDTISLLHPTALDSFSNLKNHVDRIASLPNIAAYLKSSKFVRGAIGPPFVVFGYVEPAAVQIE